MSIYRQPGFWAGLLLLAGGGWLHGEEPLYVLDFSVPPPGKAVPWLKANGFEVKLGFEALHPRFENGALWLNADRPEAGLCEKILPRAQEIAGAKFLRVVWGVQEAPEGADWEHEVNRLALSVNVSFGHDRLPSGLPLGLYAAPYFLAPFIGAKGVEGKVYTGKYWRQGGRYLYIKAGKPGEAVTTQLNLDSLFKTQFAKAPPPITAFGLQMNTKDTRGRAAAFVKRIEFRREAAGAGE